MCLDALWNCDRGDIWCQIEVSVGCQSPCDETGCILARRCYDRWNVQAIKMWSDNNQHCKALNLACSPLLAEVVPVLLKYELLQRHPIPGGVAAAPHPWRPQDLPPNQWVLTGVGTSVPTTMPLPCLSSGFAPPAAGATERPSGHMVRLLKRPLPAPGPIPKASAPREIRPREIRPQQG